LFTAESHWRNLIGMPILMIAENVPLLVFGSTSVATRSLRRSEATSVGGWDMKKAARSTRRAPVSRAQQILSVRRRLAFIRELERRLKEQTAVLDAYKPARKAA
jgi:hypothetical protein